MQTLCTIKKILWYYESKTDPHQSTIMTSSFHTQIQIVAIWNFFCVFEFYLNVHLIWMCSLSLWFVLIKGLEVDRLNLIKWPGENFFRRIAQQTKLCQRIHNEFDCLLRLNKMLVPGTQLRLSHTNFGGSFSLNQNIQFVKCF